MKILQKKVANMELKNVLILHLILIMKHLGKLFLNAENRMNYGRHYNDEDLDMFYRKHLRIDELDYIYVYVFMYAKAMDYEIKPCIYELTDLNTVSPEDLEIKADVKFMKTISTTK